MAKTEQGLPLLSFGCRYGWYTKTVRFKEWLAAALTIILSFYFGASHPLAIRSREYRLCAFWKTYH